MKRSDKRRALRAAAAQQAVCRLPAPLRADAGAVGQPKWQKIFPFGTFHNGCWPAEGITVDAKYCATMVENWKKRGAPPLPVDYLHRGGDHDEVADLPAAEKVASGWMEDFEVRADGMYALTKWTPRAHELITADEYRYLSPEWQRNGTDGRTGVAQGPTLVGAALVNRPAFQELPRVAAAALPPAQTQPVVQENAMNRAQIDALLKEAGITLAATATDAEAAAALSKHVTETSKAGAAAAELALKAKKDAETLKAAQAESEKTMKAQLDEAIAEKAKLGVRVANIEKQALDTAVNALCARALDERRIAAAGQESVKALAAASGLEAATKFVDTFAKGTIAASNSEKGHGGAGDVDAAEETEVKAAAAELVKASDGKLLGSAAIRAAAMANPGVLKRLAAVPTATAPKS